jgi:hypothetical protein
MPQFLSDEWFDQVEQLRADMPEPAPAVANLKLNLTVAGGPDGDKDIHLAGGAFGRGHVDGAETKLTVPFDTAKQMFVLGNQQAAMQAFMSGQIKVEGDMSKLMAMQSAGGPTPEQQAFQEKLKAITDE